MPDKLLMISWDHKQSGIDFRDRIVLSEDSLRNALLGLTGENAVIREAGALGTCNRMEWYFLTGDTGECRRLLYAYYSEVLGVDIGAGDPLPRVLEDMGAVGHIQRVAAGLESLMVGENQILGQMRSAYEMLLESERKSPVLTRLFREALHTGKLVRERTDIAKGAVSVSMAAVEMSRRVFSDFRTKKVLIVGAGESGALAAKHFQTLEAGELMIANRGRDRGQRLADELGGRYIPLEELRPALAEADIAVAVTGSREYLIDREMMKWVMKVRRNRFLFLADISSPRNIDPGVEDFSNTLLVDMDTLEDAVRVNLEKRRGAMAEAEKICDMRAGEFGEWLKTMDVIPTISSLASYFDSVRRQILNEYAHKSSEESLAQMDEATKRIVKRILHNPIKYLRDRAGEENVDVAEISTIWQIFKLEKMLEKYQIKDRA